MGKVQRIMGLSGLEVLHLFYALAGVVVLGLCLFVICSRRKRRDRTINSMILTLVSLCYIFENIVIAFGSAIGEGEGLDRLSRARLIVHSVMAPGFIIVLTRLAARFRIQWPGLDDAATADQLQLHGNIWTGVACVVSAALLAFCVVRDAEEVMEPTKLSGTMGYTHEHVNWGLTWDDFQEWFPTLVLLVWSLPVALLIHRQGGLKWYKNKTYLAPLWAEILLFISRCMPQEYSAHVSNGAELLLLITFIFIENKLSGEIQEIRLLEKMIKIRQEESGIVGVLEQRYPIQKPGSALAPQVASTGSEPEHFRMAEPVDIYSTSYYNQPSSRSTGGLGKAGSTSRLNKAGFVSPSQMLGLDVTLHEAASLEALRQSQLRESTRTSTDAPAKDTPVLSRRVSHTATDFSSKVQMPQLRRPQVKKPAARKGHARKHSF